MITPLVVGQSAQKDGERASRTAILVLGMHRSGTSALAGALIRLGAAPPATLMTPLEANPLGYWESRLFMDFHDRLLDAAGSAWDHWTPFNADAIGFDHTAQLSDNFERLLCGEFGDAPLFVMKDPRICRFVPFWLRNLRAANIDAAAVIPLRSPLAVAQSLAARDGMGIPHALLLWLRHVLEAEIGTRGGNRCIVRYEDLLTDWHAVVDTIAARLNIEWPIAPADVEHEMADFLRRELCHHAERFDHLPVAAPLSDWVLRANAALEALARDDSPAAIDAYEQLDAIRAEFDQITDIFAPVLAEQRSTAAAQLARRHQENVSALEREHRAATQSLEEQLQTSRQESVAELQRLQAELDARVVEADELRTALAASVADLERIQSELALAGEEREQLRGEVHVATNAALHLENELGTATAQRDELQASLNVATGELELTRQDRDRQAQGLAALHETAEALRIQTDQKERQLESLTRDLEIARARVADLLASVSWRMTAPLRRAKDLLSPPPER